MPWCLKESVFSWSGNYKSGSVAFDFEKQRKCPTGVAEGVHIQWNINTMKHHLIFLLNVKLSWLFHCSFYISLLPYFHKILIHLFCRWTIIFFQLMLNEWKCSLPWWRNNGLKAEFTVTVLAEAHFSLAVPTERWGLPQPGAGLCPGDCVQGRSTL